MGRPRQGAHPKDPAIPARDDPTQALRPSVSDSDDADESEGDDTLMNESSDDDDDESFTDAPLAESIRGSNKRKRVNWLSLFTKNGRRK